MAVLVVIWIIIFGIGLFIRLRIAFLQHKLNKLNGFHEDVGNESRGIYDTINNHGTSRRVPKKQPF